MLIWLQHIALVAALVVFVLAATNVPVRPNLLALGLALLTLAALLAGFGGPLPALR